MLGFKKKNTNENNSWKKVLEYINQNLLKTTNIKILVQVIAFKSYLVVCFEL